MKRFLTRSYTLSLIHQIPAEFVGDECSNTHGHDFKVAVTLYEAEISIPYLDRVVETELLRPYRTQALKDLQLQFTGEALAHEFLTRLQAGALGSRCISVQLVETRKNRFQALSAEFRS
jgi:6-pyruvoyl tetrahydropterin synthase